jgi:hypothetical protein
VAGLGVADFIELQHRPMADEVTAKLQAAIDSLAASQATPTAP